MYLAARMYMFHLLHTSNIVDMFLWQYHFRHFHQPNSLSLKQQSNLRHSILVPIRSYNLEKFYQLSPWNYTFKMCTQWSRSRISTTRQMLVKIDSKICRGFRSEGIASHWTCWKVYFVSVVDFWVIVAKNWCKGFTFCLCINWWKSSIVAWFT